MAERWGRRLFQSGALFLLLLGAVHSLSFFETMIPANATEKQLLDLMVNYKFNLMGTARSMADLLRGFSVSFMVSVLGFGIVDLLLSCERAALLKRLALINAIWLAAMTAISLRYFFAAPTSFLIAALLIFMSAWLTLPGEHLGRN